LRESFALTTPFLSIILPAHNEEQRLPKTLDEINVFIQAQSYPVEVVLVENGSADRTLELAQEYAVRQSYLKVIHEEQRGKGRAVRTGMLATQGQYRIFCDVDFSMPVSEISRFIPPVLPDSQVAIGSREAPGAIRYHEPYYRHLSGRVFNTLVRLLALPGLQDTQCGFKCFRGDIADEIFPLQTNNGWTFDVEVLYIARQRGYKIVEVPIPWYFNPESKIRMARDSWNMVRELLAIRRNSRAGLYRKQ
jgi:glycosyltransferase involved in cell wall biosynthesis